uniref:Flavodoxin-like domain-containing protein n=1 Tax=Percolomonas cosmopolitus TaxID=63605 RepID=A0A7S1KQZ0_9EUKA
MAAKVLVLFYSTYGHIFQMAEAVAEGAKKAGAEVTIKRVKETLSQDILAKMYAADAQKQFEHIPIISGPEELKDYDAIIFGTPTRFGMMAGQMKNFLDACGGLWAANALVGKVAGVFTSSATQHGGQESTILSFHTVLLHLGFLICGMPYSFKGQTGVDEVKGGSPYGASTIANSTGDRLPSDVEKEGAAFQGEHIATIAGKLARD